MQTNYMESCTRCGKLHPVPRFTTTAQTSLCAQCQAEQSRLQEQQAFVQRVAFHALKYAAIALLGLYAYYISAQVAFAQRGYVAYGGECFFLLLPFFWWLFGGIAKDMLSVKWL